MMSTSLANTRPCTLTKQVFSFHFPDGNWHLQQLHRKRLLGCLQKRIKLFLHFLDVFLGFKTKNRLLLPQLLVLPRSPSAALPGLRANAAQAGSHRGRAWDQRREGNGGHRSPSRGSRRGPPVPEPLLPGSCWPPPLPPWVAAPGPTLLVEVAEEERDALILLLLREGPAVGLHARVGAAPLARGLPQRHGC